MKNKTYKSAADWHYRTRGFSLARGLIHFSRDDLERAWEAAKRSGQGQTSATIKKNQTDRLLPHLKTALPLLEDAHRNGRAGLWEAIELFRELTDDIS